VFTLSNNQGGSGYAWWMLAPSSGNTTVIGNISNNIFNVSNHSSENIGINIAFDLSNQTADFEGSVINNKFTIVGDDGIDNIGIKINPTGNNSAVVFHKAVENNEIKINNDLTAEDGFNLETTSSSTIRFNGNKSQAELSASNNGAFVEDNGSTRIYYNEFS
jgi:hypothetical protein